MAPRRSTRQKIQQTAPTPIQSGRVTKKKCSVKEESRQSTSTENLLKPSSQQPSRAKSTVFTSSKRNVGTRAVSNKKNVSKVSSKKKQSKVIDEETKLRELQELKYKYRQCQTCFQLFDSYFRAECCFRSHGDRSLRCFFCVTTFPDTSALYEHYNNGPHEKGAKEETLICTLCNKTVKFSGASTHVISMHLTENEFEVC